MSKRRLTELLIRLSAVLWLLGPLAAVATAQCEWSALGSGMDSPVYALTVFDDGGGPALYAGGLFTTAEGASANYIAKWDGSSWSALGSGMDSYVYALTVFDDGGGPALYAGGEFTTAGGAGVNYIAKWNGSSWSALGSGMNFWVFALKGFDDGGGPALYAGGIFTTAGGVSANQIAKWNGSSWSSVGTGIDGDAGVFALEGFDDGGGPALYAGGRFTTAGGASANHIARWNGSSWSALGSGVTERNEQVLAQVLALTVFDDGGGPDLYAGGFFSTAGGASANNIAKWNGSSWSALGSEVDYGLRALTVFDDGGGPDLYAGGAFTTAGGVGANYIARWNGSSWSALGSGMDSYVYALTVFDDGGGPALYAGGEFTTAGGAGANYIAQWSCPPVTRIFVDDSSGGANNGTSWADAFVNLQGALSYAATHPEVTEIWVAAGTYKPVGPGGSRGATFQPLNGVGLYGGFRGMQCLGGPNDGLACVSEADCTPGTCYLGETSLSQRNPGLNLTILSGDLASNDVPAEFPGGPSYFDNSFHVVVSNGNNNSAILDGFTITAGFANGVSADNNGGGAIINNSAAVIRNCRIFRNAADNETMTGSTGGGIEITLDSSPQFIGCTFEDNRAPNAGGSGGAVECLGSLSMPNFMDCQFLGNQAGAAGGGMYSNEGSHPVLTNCTFSGNSANNGGGMYNINNSSPNVTDCTFSGNSAGEGGGMYNGLNSAVVVTGCTFAGNSAACNGGGMLNDEGSPVVTECTFTGNSAANCDGGGMFNVGGSPKVIDCTFSGNSALAGGGMANSHLPLTVTNCTFSGNSADVYGGGMYNLTGSPTVTNCTFSGNSATSEGGGMFSSDGSSPPMTNSIFWGNSDAGGMDESAQIHPGGGGGRPTVNYSIVQGGWTGAGGAGNSASNPVFVDPDGPDNIPGTLDDDLRLQPGSPAIDAGNNAAVPADVADLDGDGNTAEPTPWDLDEHIRFVDDPSAPDCPIALGTCGTPPIVDMGAYEFGSQPDCNGNGIPDADDIANCMGNPLCGDCNNNGVPNECEIPPIGLGSDCNANGVPDECDIEGGPSDDCNLNGVPDECDIAPGGGSQDANMDGIPDECTDFEQGCAADDPSWTCVDNWPLAGGYPDSDGSAPQGVPDLSVTLDQGELAFVDEDITIDTLRILEGATLSVTQVGVEGDFTTAQPGGILNEGNLLVGDGRTIDVSAGAFTVQAGGVYQAHPEAPGPVRATLNAGSVTVVGADPNAPLAFAGITGPGSIILSGSMVMESLGSLTLQIVPHKGDGTPPPSLSTSGSASLTVTGDLIMLGAVELDVNSSNPLTVGGNFQNYITLSNQADHLFNWSSTLLFTADSSHTIEAAGEDRGPWPGGMVDNFVIGTLELAANATLTVVDVFDNQEDGVIACDEALYIGTLILQPGSTLISNGCPVYYGALQGGPIDDEEDIEGLRPVGDITDDTIVNALDLAQLLGCWGPCPSDCALTGPCLCDLNADCVVNAADLAQLLGNWG